ncbi:hypothetical protein [Streptomyces sp. NPDC002082]|uniref:hypothetical protein n=1 Tax=Streptomyces sp. NPDC002082 TaxID=3154772 RepID=UPI00331E0CCF
MDLDAELSALAAQEDLPADLVRRLLQHPGARRSVALLRRDLTDELIAEIIELGSVRTLAANTSVPSRIRARFAEHPEQAVRRAVAASIRDEPLGLLARLAADPDPSADLLPGLLADPATRAAAVAYAVPTPELAADPDSDVREAVAAHPDLPPGLRDLVAGDQDIFVRNAIAARSDIPPALRAQVVGTLEHDSPLVEWMLSFSRGTHTCPPAAPAPPNLTRQQAESLLAQAGL